MAEIAALLGELGGLVGVAQVSALLVGLILGIIVGVLPGLGPLLGVTLAIPFTFHMDPVSSIALLIGFYQGGSYGGAVTATVLGIPGTPIAAATLLDAHPMALAGRASEAVTLATLASWVGGLIGGTVLLLTAPALAKIAIRFGPAETFALAALGLTAIASLSQGSTLKGLMSGLFGLMCATIGTDPFTSIARFNFGRTEFSGGLTFVALLVGLFAISEVLMQIERTLRGWQASGRIGVAFSMFKTVFTHFFGYLRASLVGVGIGIIPAVGGVTSAFLAYKLARDFSKEPERFGKGAPEGVIASEAANSATTGGALIPMLALGIPGDPIVAVMMGGLLIHGVTPGPMLFFTNLDVLNGIFATFLIGALLLLPLGLALLPVFIRVLRVPLDYMLAGVLLLAIFGTFAVQRQTLDLWIMWLFGIVGYAMRKAGFPLAPLVIGFVLGPIVEVNLRRAATLASSDLAGYFLGRPIALCILILALLALVFPVLRALWQRRSGAG